MTAPNPAMAEALKSAGITMPVIQRVWNVIKEAGRLGITGPDVHARLKAIPSGGIGAALNSMHNRGMVVYTEELTAKGRTAYRYTTDMATYELLPMPAKPPADANPVGLPAHTPAPAPVPVVLERVDHETLFAMSVGKLMQAWIGAGLDPQAMLLMPVSQFIRAAAKRGLIVTIEGK